MTRVRTKKIAITGCGMCPHLKQVQSPYTGDSFDMIDEDAICSKTGKMFAVSERTWALDRILKRIPDWCPL